MTDTHTFALFGFVASQGRRQMSASNASLSIRDPGPGVVDAEVVALVHNLPGSADLDGIWTCTAQSGTGALEFDAILDDATLDEPSTAYRCTFRVYGPLTYRQEESGD